jgi:hypothetical protein
VSTVVYKIILKEKKVFQMANVTASISTREDDVIQRTSRMMSFSERLDDDLIGLGSRSGVKAVVKATFVQVQYNMR